MTSRAAQRIRGLFAALALLSFVAGIPCGLLALGADPDLLIPDRWPDPVPISHWPQLIWNTLRWAWLTGDLVIWLIVAVAWAGWLALTISVVVEVIRQTGHGVRAACGLLSRVPRGRWIAGLVAAVLVATSAGTAAASGAPAAPVAATAPPWPHTHPVTAARESGASTVPDPGVRTAAAVAAVPEAARVDNAVPYTVVHGDTLWGLAKRHLGKGTRYHEIVRLNPALLGDTPDELEPGWTLLLPPDAVGLPRPADTITAIGRTVTVRPSDTLSGIAERELGDPDAWPALFDLNAGRVQPDGRALRHPDQLLPGWNLVLPAEPPPPPAALPDQPTAPPGVPLPEPAPPSPGGSPASAERPAPPQAPRGDEQRAPDAHPGTGISLSTSAFVGLGLAALITIAMITVRIRRRRWYQPGSQDRADPAGLPVVRALRIAHDAATRTLGDDDMPVTAPALPTQTRPAEMDTRDRAQATVRAVLSASQNTPVGVRDGQAIALDLARMQGLGLVGPGAKAAARALIVTLLAQATSDGLDATIVIPAYDARSLFGHDLPDRVPERLRIVDDLPAALDVLEAELLARTHADDAVMHDPPAHAPQPRSGNGPLLVVAVPTGDTDLRAHTVLDNGSHVGLAGVFLGPWRPGGTARVRGDGTVEAATPTLSEDLTSARLFTLPDTDALDLLTLLQAADHRGDELARNRIPSDSADDPATKRPSRAENTTNAEQLISEYEFIRAVPDPAVDTATASAAPPTSAVIDIPSGHSVAGLSRAAEVAGSMPSSPDASNDTPNSSALCGNDRTTAEHATTGPCPADPLHLQVLGRLHLTRANPEPLELIEAFAPRQREILVYLALHREGCRRETLSAALWPDAPGERPYNSFHATLSQLRRGLRRATQDNTLDIIVNQDSHYGFDQTTVTVDVWQLQEALAASRQGSPADAIAALNRVAELYRGDLAEGISADWIEGPREALRRDVLDALSILIRKIRNDDPEQALALLEHARQLDPYNEAIYRDLMRMQARLGQHDSIPRTLHLLATSMSDLDQRPARDTLSLADALRRQENHLRNRQAS